MESSVFLLEVIEAVGEIENIGLEGLQLSGLFTQANELGDNAFKEVAHIGLVHGWISLVGWLLGFTLDIEVSQ
jgi:hypothetical protein